jgi:hypothetical protein
MRCGLLHGSLDVHSGGICWCSTVFSIRVSICVGHSPQTRLVAPAATFARIRLRNILQGLALPPVSRLSRDRFPFSPTVRAGFKTPAYAKDQASLLRDGLLRKTRHPALMIIWSIWPVFAVTERNNEFVSKFFLSLTFCLYADIWRWASASSCKRASHICYQHSTLQVAFDSAMCKFYLDIHWHCPLFAMHVCISRTFMAFLDSKFWY